MTDDATRVRVIRAILGVTSGDFAALVGVDRATLTNWEKGKTRPQQTYQLKLSEICKESNISINEDGFPVPVYGA